MQQSKFLEALLSSPEMNHSETPYSEMLHHFFIGLTLGKNAPQCRLCSCVISLMACHQSKWQLRRVTNHLQLHNNQLLRRVFTGKHSLSFTHLHHEITGSHSGCFAPMVTLPQSWWLWLSHDLTVVLMAVMTGTRVLLYVHVTKSLSLVLPNQWLWEVGVINGVSIRCLLQDDNTTAGLMIHSGLHCTDTMGLKSKH